MYAGPECMSGNRRSIVEIGHAFIRGNLWLRVLPGVA